MTPQRIAIWNHLVQEKQSLVLYCVLETMSCDMVDTESYSLNSLL